MSIATNRQVPPTFNRMAEPLKQLHGKIRRLLDQTTGREVLRHHEIGQLVVKAMNNPDKYGEGAVKQLAKALDVSDDFLYRCAKVAEFKTMEELKQLRQRTNKFGLKITFTHLALISAVADIAGREELLEEFFEEGLTTDEIAQRTRGPIAKEKRLEQIRSANAGVGLLSLRRRAEEYLKHCIDLREDVLDKIGDAIVARDTSHLDALKETRLSQEKLRQEVDKTIKELDSWIKSAEEVNKEKEESVRTAKTPAWPKTTTASRKQETPPRAKS